MNAANAFGFLALGWVMKMLPFWDPHGFPPTGCDGSNAQAIWLQAMGWIEILLGGSYFFRHVLVPAAWARVAFPLPQDPLDTPRAAIPVNA